MGLSLLVLALELEITDKTFFLKYVVANILKQPSDGPLVWALDAAGINEITDLLTLDHIKEYPHI